MCRLEGKCLAICSILSSISVSATCSTDFVMVCSMGLWSHTVEAFKTSKPYIISDLTWHDFIKTFVVQSWARFFFAPKNPKKTVTSKKQFFRCEAEKHFEDATKLEYTHYVKYIEERFPPEVPQMFGLPLCPEDWSNWIDSASFRGGKDLKVIIQWYVF